VRACVQFLQFLRTVSIPTGALGSARNEKIVQQIKEEAKAKREAKQRKNNIVPTVKFRQVVNIID